MFSGFRWDIFHKYTIYSKMVSYEIFYLWPIFY